MCTQWRPFWFSSFTWNSTTFVFYIFFFSCYFRSLIANTHMCSCTHGTKLTLVATRIFFNTKPYKYCLTVVALLTVSFLFFNRRQPWRVKYVHTNVEKKEEISFVSCISFFTLQCTTSEKTTTRNAHIYTELIV